MLTHPVLLLFFLQFVQCLQFTVPVTLAQCTSLDVEWSDSAPGPSDFNLTFLPFDSVPFNVTVPESAWTSNEAGTYSTTFPLMAGTSFILATGTNSSAATSNIVTVTPSNDSSCLTPTSPSKFIFNTAPTNCQPESLNISYFAANRSDVPTLRGFVPSGGAPFDITPVGIPPTWFVTVTEETQMVLEFLGTNSSYGTSKLLTVGGPLGVGKCFSALFFSGTTKSTTSAVVPSSSSNQNRSAKLLGIIIGSILGTFAIGWVSFLIRERRKAKKVDRGIRGGKAIEDDEWGFATKNELGNQTPRGIFVQDKELSSSRAFPYANSGTGQNSNTSLSLPSSRRPPMTERSASGRLTRSPARSRTPLQQDSFADMSLNASYLPDLQLRRADDTLSRQQTRESGRVI